MIELYKKHIISILEDINDEKALMLVIKYLEAVRQYSPNNKKEDSHE